MTERMVTSETGGRKGQKGAQLGTIDPKALLVLAEVGGKGAEKYARHNYLKGYDWSLSFDALQRHSLAFWAGEDTDPESGLPHMAHAAFHALALVSFLTRGLGTDDRFKQAVPLSDSERGLLAPAVKPPSAIPLCACGHSVTRHSPTKLYCTVGPPGDLCACAQYEAPTP